MSTVIDALLCLGIVRMSGDEIGAIREATLYSKAAFGEMPPYCLDRNGRIKRTEYYHQYTREGKDPLWLFDMEYADRPLAMEISNEGLEDFFAETDIDFRPLFALLPHNTAKDFLHAGSSAKLIVRLEYVGSYCEGVYELDRVDRMVIAYMDSQLARRPLRFDRGGLEVIAGGPRLFRAAYCGRDKTLGCETGLTYILKIEEVKDQEKVLVYPLNAAGFDMAPLSYTDVSAFFRDWTDVVTVEGLPFVNDTRAGSDTLAMILKYHDA